MMIHSMLSKRPIQGSLLLVAAILLLAGCDMGGLDDFGDDFSLIIELEPINTTVNAQVVDAGTLEPIGDVELTFGGADAASLIDVYSDPLSALTAGKGIVSFGVHNAVVPTPESPVTFTVAARREGYLSARQRVTLAETGSGALTIYLTPSNATQQVPGTSGTTNREVATDAGGRLAAAVQVSTPAQTDVGARAELSLPAGAAAVDREGRPLTGQLTTSLRVFDGGIGLSRLPHGAGLASGGRSLAVAGAAYLKITDASGRTAAAFSAGPAAGGTSKGTGTCEANGGVALSMVLTDPELQSFYEALAASGPVVVDLWAFTPADERNVQVGSVELSRSDGDIVAVACIGGGAADVSLADVGDVGEGIIFSASLRETDVQSCMPGTSLTVSNPNAGGADAVVALSGPGLYRKSPGATSLGAGESRTHTLGRWLGLGPDEEVSFVREGVYQLVVETGGERTVTPISDLCSGSADVALPSLDGYAEYAVSATLACPAGEEFEVQMTERSLDGLSVYYRQEGATETYQLLSKSAFDERTVSDDRISLTLRASLRRATTYRVRAVYGTESASHDITTPAEGQAFEFELSPDDVGLACVAR